MHVVAITPVHSENGDDIRAHAAGMHAVARELSASSVALTTCYLDDVAGHFPPELPRLVRHHANTGLVRTLLDGYAAVLALQPRPDVVVRLDCLQHDLRAIAPLIASLESTRELQMVASPIAWASANSPDPLPVDVERSVTAVRRALCPIDPPVLAQEYFARVELAHQAFRIAALERMEPVLRQSASVHARLFGSEMKWGLDLLALLVGANMFQARLEFIPLSSSPWIGTRGEDQKTHIPRRTLDVLRVARALELPFVSGHGNSCVSRSG